MIRWFDTVLSAFGLLLLSPLMLMFYLACSADTRSPLLCQVRVGRHRNPFTLVKFRTMRTDTVHVATHIADPTAITRLGAILRRTKLDELPQLWNVLKGEMSLEGPCPCLFSQEVLIVERAVRRGWPLPLGAVHNQRSLVSLDNLVDFIVTRIIHPQAANQTFLVSDGQDLSTTELVRCIAQAAGVSARLLRWVPPVSVEEGLRRTMAV